MKEFKQFELSLYIVQLMVIPPMTDPMGKYWEQPDRANIAIDDKIALMTESDFDKLKNYELSNPTGIYVGKMWRSGNTLRWYDRIENTPNNRKIMIIERRQIEFII